MTYQLMVVAEALEDFNSIYHWIKQESNIGASRWLASYEAQIIQLLNQPLIYPLAPENSLVNFEVRHCFFGTSRKHNYRILYTIEGDQIVILKIRSPRQNLINDW